MTVLDTVALMILWGVGIVLVAGWLSFLGYQYDCRNYDAVVLFGGFPVSVAILWALYWVIWRL